MMMMMMMMDINDSDGKYKNIYIHKNKSDFFVRASFPKEAWQPRVMHTKSPSGILAVVEICGVSPPFLPSGDPLPKSS